MAHKATMDANSSRWQRRAARAVGGRPEIARLRQSRSTAAQTRDTRQLLGGNRGIVSNLVQGWAHEGTPADTDGVTVTAVGGRAAGEPVALAQASEYAPLRRGMMFHHYQLVRELGRGGMGVVYLAHDTRLGRRVAMKILVPTDDVRTARFLSEARATARCEHDNIVSMYRADAAQGHFYMVLEYLEGVTLRQWMQQCWQVHASDAVHKHGLSGNLIPTSTDARHYALLSPTLAVELMVPVVRALVHAHQLGLVHRDLKPENIMLTDEGSIKVLDFGIAKLLDEQMRSPVNSDNTPDTGGTPGGESRRKTRAGALLGTMPYMSPEQWGIDDIDARSDIWAVGIMFWELCTGQHPLTPTTRVRLMEVANCRVPMPCLAAARPDLGPLAAIVDRCLAQRKADRMPSARALLAALESLLPDRGAEDPILTREIARGLCGLPALQGAACARP